MPPILRLPNHGRLTVNHLKRLKNSMNRQGALYGAGNNNNYNGAAALREMNIRRNIAREVGMTQREIAPYYHKYLNLREANTRRRGNLGARVNARVRSAARRFLVRPRMSAMRGQLASAHIPREIRNVIASMMLTPRR